MIDLAGTPWRWLSLSDTRGVVCLVDAHNWPWIVAHKWNIGWKPRAAWKFYAKRNIGAERSTLYLHREIMIRLDPHVALDEMHADHINGQSLDDREENLRWCSPAQNRANTKRREDIPSLDAIARQLVAGWRARPAVAAAAAEGFAEAPF